MITATKQQITIPMIPAAPMPHDMENFVIALASSIMLEAKQYLPGSDIPFYLTEQQHWSDSQPESDVQTADEVVVHVPL